MDSETQNVPKEPLPIFLPIRYLPPTRKSILPSEPSAVVLPEWGIGRDSVNLEGRSRSEENQVRGMCT